MKWLPLSTTPVCCLLQHYIATPAGTSKAVRWTSLESLRLKVQRSVHHTCRRSAISLVMVPGVTCNAAFAPANRVALWRRRGSSAFTPGERGNLAWTHLVALQACMVSLQRSFEKLFNARTQDDALYHYRGGNTYGDYTMLCDAKAAEYTSSLFGVAAVCDVRSGVPMLAYCLRLRYA
jgi:hypothetical protein